MLGPEENEGPGSGQVDTGGLLHWKTDGLHCVALQPDPGPIQGRWRVALAFSFWFEFLP